MKIKITRPTAFIHRSGSLVKTKEVKTENGVKVFRGGYHADEIKTELGPEVVVSYDFDLTYAGPAPWSYYDNLIMKYFSFIDRKKLAHSDAGIAAYFAAFGAGSSEDAAILAGIGTVTIS